MTTCTHGHARRQAALDDRSLSRFQMNHASGGRSRWHLPFASRVALTTPKTVVGQPRQTRGATPVLVANPCPSGLEKSLPIAGSGCSAGEPRVLLLKLHPGERTRSLGDRGPPCKRIAGCGPPVPQPPRFLASRPGDLQSNGRPRTCAPQAEAQLLMLLGSSSKGRSSSATCSAASRIES